MLKQKLYNQFHVSKNGIRVGNFQKKNIFPNIQLKYVVNRYKKMYDHTNKFLMGNDDSKIKHYITYLQWLLRSNSLILYSETPKGLKNLSVIEWCPLLEGNIKKIVTFGN